MKTPQQNRQSQQQPSALEAVLGALVGVAGLALVFAIGWALWYSYCQTAPVFPILLATILVCVLARKSKTPFGTATAAFAFDIALGLALVFIGALFLPAWDNQEVDKYFRPTMAALLYLRGDLKHWTDKHWLMLAIISASFLLSIIWPRLRFVDATSRARRFATTTSRVLMVFTSFAVSSQVPLEQVTNRAHAALVRDYKIALRADCDASAQYAAARMFDKGITSADSLAVRRARKVLKEINLRAAGVPVDEAPLNPYWGSKNGPSEHGDLRGPIVDRLAKSQVDKIAFDTDAIDIEAPSDYFSQTTEFENAVVVPLDLVSPPSTPSGWATQREILSNRQERAERTAQRARDATESAKGAFEAAIGSITSDFGLPGEYATAVIAEYAKKCFDLVAAAIAGKDGTDYPDELVPTTEICINIVIPLNNEASETGHKIQTLIDGTIAEMIEEEKTERIKGTEERIRLEDIEVHRGIEVREIPRIIP